MGAKRKNVVTVSEASMNAIVRGLLNLEAGGKTGAEIARLKLLGDVDIFRQPGQAYERLGHRLRGLLGQLVALGIVVPEQVGSLLRAAGEQARVGGLSLGGGSMTLSDDDEADAGLLQAVREAAAKWGVEAGTVGGALIGSMAGGVGAGPGAAAGAAAGAVIEEFAEED